MCLFAHCLFVTHTHFVGFLHSLVSALIAAHIDAFPSLRAAQHSIARDAADSGRLTSDSSALHSEAHVMSWRKLTRKLREEERKHLARMRSVVCLQCLFHFAKFIVPCAAHSVNFPRGEDFGLYCERIGGSAEGSRGESRS